MMNKRIPQSFIDELLSRIDIVQVIEPRLTLKKAGSNYSALCPFHQEKSPSFTVSPAKQFYYCFGCGARGNAISFLMNYEHAGFLEAIEQLAQIAGMPLPAMVDSHTAAESGQQHLFEILEKAAQYYQYQLQNHPLAQKAKSYLKNRGLNAEVIKQFALGYAPPGWESLLKSLTASKREALDSLQQVGLIVENDEGKRYDRFRDRIMFPIKDRRGRVIGFGGRVLDDSTPKYLNSPETILFHKGQELYGLYEARQKHDLRQIIVVEGYMDVIALQQQGISGVVATLGTAITAAHIQRLARICKNIVFCFDGDLAGQKAAWKALEISLPVLTDDLLPKFLFLPSEDDPDSFIRREGKFAFIEKAEHAMPLVDFLLESLKDQVNLETLAGRSQLVANAVPYLQKIQAPITKELLVEALAKLAHTDLDKLRDWVLHGEKPAAPEEASYAQKPAQLQTPVRLAITLLLQHPALLKQISPQWPKANLPGLDLLCELTEIIKGHSNITTGALLEYWRDRPEIKALSKLAAVELLVSVESMLAELKDCMWRIELECNEAEIGHLMNKAASHGLDNDERQLLQKYLQQKQKIFPSGEQS